MNILIRCDSSNIIGTGHVMRCLNLCEYYPENIYTFVCRKFKMNITDKIKEKGHKLILFEYDIEPEIEKYRTWIGVEYEKEIKELCEIISKQIFDEIIIDHYGIDYILEKKIREYCKKITLISDIFDYKHYVDVYINYNCDELDKIKSINLNPDTDFKIGVENLIINKKFKGRKKEIFNDKIKKICIMMGGSDPPNYTLKVIKEINDIVIENNLMVYIVLGKANNHFDILMKQINKNYEIMIDLNYDELIELYMKIDLCIGSLSVTAYERLMMRIPQICLKIVDNQNIQKLEEFNICEIGNIRDKFKKYV